MVIRRTRVAGAARAVDELNMLRFMFTTLLGAAVLFLPAAAHF
jgi:hypothetical protein